MTQIPSNRISISSPINFDDSLPEKVDTVIIGGGVIGVFAALNLAEAGQHVLLCEKGRIAGEQSSRNWGWIRQQGRDEDELPIAMQSVGLWKEIDQKLGGQCGVKESGVSYLTTSESEMEDYEKWMQIASRHNLHSELLSAADVKSTFTADSTHNWIGGVHTPSDCKGEPWQAVPAVAKHAHSLGVKIKENCAVRKLDIQAGSISGVHTEFGHVGCEQVVVACGAWSRLFLGAHGIKIPQLSVLATAAQSGRLSDFSSSSCADEELAFRRRDDGGYTLALTDRHVFHFGWSGLASVGPWFPEARRNFKHISFAMASPKNFPDSWSTKRRWRKNEITPFEKNRVLEPYLMKGAVSRMQKRFSTRFPDLGTLQIEEAWSGMIDAMPDVVPIVDSIPTLPSVFLATGMSGHGFGIGPGFGRVIARRLLSLPDEHNLSRFRFDRFTDGSVLKPGPSL